VKREAEENWGDSVLLERTSSYNGREVCASRRRASCGFLLPFRSDCLFLMPETRERSIWEEPAAQKA